MNVFFIKALNEYSVVVYAGEIVDEATFHRVTAINKAIYDVPFTGFIEAVPAYVSLTVYYDPVKVLGDNNLQGSYAFERVTNYIKQLSITVKDDVQAAVPPITIPVCYGNEYGPDIDAIAQHNNLSVEQVVQLHTQPIYLVHMLGFMPGFAYLGGMDKALATPRKLQPRNEVPAGSVGIAGEQTGIYPFSSPGGWQLIGRTPLPLFNANSDAPTLLKAGDRVQFEAITEAQFNDLKKSNEHHRN